MPDLRKEPRVRANNPISWETEEGEYKGKARIRNISQSGMTIETETATYFKDNAVLIFDSGLATENFVPKEGHVVWRKEKNKLSEHQLLGIQFINSNGQTGEMLKAHLAKGQKSQRFWDGMQNVIAVVLLLLSAALIVYTSWLYFDVQKNIRETNNQLAYVVDKQSALTRNFANLYVEFRNLYNVTQEKLDAATQELDATRKLYDESQQMLQQVTLELNNTRGILVKTQNMISSMLGQLGIASDQASLNENQLLDKQSEFETAVNSLQERNQRLAEELELIKQQLLFYAGEVKDADQAKEWFKMYRDRVKKVKQRIKVFRQETHTIKVAAQQELDRIQSDLGNNGYLMKDGQVVDVDEAAYNSVTLEQVINQTQNTPAPSVHKRVEIDVNFFK